MALSFVTSSYPMTGLHRILVTFPQRLAFHTSPIGFFPFCSRSARLQAMDVVQEEAGVGEERGPKESMKLLFVEMGVGYDQHGQDITKAAMKSVFPYGEILDLEVLETMGDENMEVNSIEQLSLIKIPVCEL